MLSSGWFSGRVVASVARIVRHYSLPKVLQNKLRHRSFFSLRKTAFPFSTLSLLCIHDEKERYIEKTNNKIISLLNHIIIQQIMSVLGIFQEYICFISFSLLMAASGF